MCPFFVGETAAAAIKCPGGRKRIEVKQMLKKAYQKWLRFSKIIGNFQARAILTVFYYSFLPLFAVVGKIQHGLSNSHKKNRSAWTKREKKEFKLLDLRNQY